MKASWITGIWNCLNYYRHSTETKWISNNFIIKEDKMMAIIGVSNYSSVQEEDAGKITVKDQPQVGANLDLKI